MKKHDVNIKKGKLINFQIGIIAIATFCYVINEVSHYTPINKKTTASNDLMDITYDEPMGPVDVYVEHKIIKPIVIPKKTPVPIKVNTHIIPKIIDNNTTLKTVKSKPITTTLVPNKPTGKTLSKTAITVKKTPIKKIAVLENLKTVDMLPVFPGCDKYSSNSERAVCFQDKIQRMINKKFDRSIGGELGLSGLQRINLYFEIDENGLVSNVNARSKYPEFIEEAKRVANLLPKMKPAQRRGAKVKMAYNVPIVFKTSK